MPEPKSFRCSVKFKKMARVSDSWVVGEDKGGVQDVLAAAGDCSDAALMIRDREMRTGNQCGIFSRVAKVLSDLECVDLKCLVRIPCKQLEMEPRHAGEKIEPGKTLFPGS